MSANDSENTNDAAANSGCSQAPCSGLDFSGTTCEGAEWHRAWLAFTDGEYYHRCRQIMLGYGMGGGDVEMILANFWEYGWIAAKHHSDE
jgi:hypothetical protein